MLWRLVCRVLQSQSGRHCRRRFARCGRGRHSGCYRHCAPETTPPSHQQQQQQRRCGTATAMVFLSKSPVKCNSRVSIVSAATHISPSNAMLQIRGNHVQSTVAHDPIESIAVTHRKEQTSQKRIHTLIFLCRARPRKSSCEASSRFQCPMTHFTLPLPKQQCQ
jgi:hypothetical protein